MNTLVYIGIIAFALGFFLWLYGLSRLRGLQNSFVPVPSSRIRNYQVVKWVGGLMALAGIILAIIAFR